MLRSEHRGKDEIFPYVMYAPSETTAGLPLIVQLHGAGERGDGSEAELPKVDIHGLPKVFMEADFPCVAVFPQCPRTSFWAARVESIVRFIEQIAEKYQLDRSRIYLTGLSMGGYGTWYTAMARPDLFAAIAPVCGGGMAWNASVLRMPISVWHGAEDKTVSPHQSDEMVEKLRSLGRDVTYHRLDGVAHNVWQHAYTPELVEWLLSHKK